MGLGSLDAQRCNARSRTRGRVGVVQTAKAIGNTVVAGARTVGVTLEQAGRSAEPTARHARMCVVRGAADVGRIVSRAFGRFFDR
jgi:hypothetical protein